MLICVNILLKDDLSLAGTCWRATDVNVSHKKVQVFGIRYIFAERVISCFSCGLCFESGEEIFIELYTSYLFLCHFMLIVLGKECTQVVKMSAYNVSHTLPTLYSSPL